MILVWMKSFSFFHTKKTVMLNGKSFTYRLKIARNFSFMLIKHADLFMGIRLKHSNSYPFRMMSIAEEIVFNYNHCVPAIQQNYNWLAAIRIRIENRDSRNLKRNDIQSSAAFLMQHFIAQWKREYFLKRK